MSMYRASTRAMRCNLRPCVARAQFHTSNIRPVKFEGKDMDDLGGPGGQVPPPQSPGGPEAAKRNWVPIAAGVFAVGAGFWYMTSPKQKKVVTHTKELEQKAEAKAGQLYEKGTQAAQQLENKAKNLAASDSPKSVQEMSGRHADGRAKTGFRAE